MIWMNDFTSEPEELSRQELAAIERGLRSGRFILGNEVPQFEEGWAKFCGARFCVGVANRMGAIEFGLRAGCWPRRRSHHHADDSHRYRYGHHPGWATPALADINPQRRCSIWRVLSDA